jgi:hypothetical protein
MAPPCDKDWTSAGPPSPHRLNKLRKALQTSGELRYLSLLKLSDAALNVPPEINDFQGGIPVKELCLSAQSRRSHHSSFWQILQGLVLDRDKPADMLIRTRKEGCSIPFLLR